MNKLNVNKIMYGAGYHICPSSLENGRFEEDLELMEKFHFNTVRLHISWSDIEPKEGKYSFEWLDKAFTLIAEKGLYIDLCAQGNKTPRWMLNIDKNIVKTLVDGTYPPSTKIAYWWCPNNNAYRQKMLEINEKISARYADNQAIKFWQMGCGEGLSTCYCPVCCSAYRKWLQKKYGDIAGLNNAWDLNATGENFESWEQVDPRGMAECHGANLDWKRYNSDICLELILLQREAILKHQPNTKFTLYSLGDLDYNKIIRHLDFASSLSYPFYHQEPNETDRGVAGSFIDARHRSVIPGTSFTVLEMAADRAHWHCPQKIKEPGVQKLQTITKIANGADVTLFLMWAARRSHTSKFGGSIMNAARDTGTRIHKEIEELGEDLNKLSEINGAEIDAKVAVLFDKQIQWMSREPLGPIDFKMYRYGEIVTEHYHTFCTNGIPVDVIDMTDALSRYQVVVAPVQYITSPESGKKIEKFVENGGVFVATYWSGVMDEIGKCHQMTRPAYLRDVLGLCIEETDSLYDWQKVNISPVQDNNLGLSKEYSGSELCERIHVESADILANYKNGMYAETPVVTQNNYGKGTAYFIGATLTRDFLIDFYNALIKKHQIKSVLDTPIPDGVIAQERKKEDKKYLFLSNYSRDKKTIQLNKKYYDMLGSCEAENEITLKGFDAKVLKQIE